MALNDGKTLKLLSGKGKSSRLCTSLSIDRENLFQFFLTFVKNAIQLCTCYKCPYKFSFLVNAFVFPLSCLLYGKCFFLSFSLDCKQKIWMAGHQVRVRGDHNFSSWQKKKEQEIFCSRMWACIFRVKWYTLGMHNAWHEVALKQIPHETFHEESKKFHR